MNRRVDLSVGACVVYVAIAYYCHSNYLKI